MKIIIVGATGTIGKAVADELGKRHEIIDASAHRSDVKVDITSSRSIAELYKKIWVFDAVVCCAGAAHLGPFDAMTEEDFYGGIKSKLMGQINLVRIGKEFVSDRGSFTLTSGVSADEPEINSVGAGFINGAINSFVISAAIELKRGIRINAVSPGIVEDSAVLLGLAFSERIPVPMKQVVAAYVNSVEGAITGQIIRVVE